MQHLHKAIENLQKMILSLGAQVEDSFNLTIKAMVERDTDTARKIVETDEIIDGKEVEVEEECLKILALYQPVAVDLRLIITALKINNDLERVHGLCANIASRTISLSHTKNVPPPIDFHDMADVVRDMLKKGLDAFVRLDPELAKEVCSLDDKVDSIHKEAVLRVKNLIREKPEQVDGLISWMHISKHLERIADMTTNIAEDVLYMVTGEIVRHNLDQL